MAAEHLAALGVGAGHEQVQDARAEIEAVHDGVDGDHHGDQPEPEHFHGGLLVLGVWDRAVGDFPADQEQEQQPQHEEEPGETEAGEHRLARVHQVARCRRRCAGARTPARAGGRARPPSSPAVLAM